MPEIEKCETCGKLILGEKITLDLTEYLAIKKAALAFAEYEKRLAHIVSVSRSPIFRNAALADFILESCKTMTQVQIVTACKAAFGEHAPSSSAINRYLKAIQTALTGSSKPFQTPTKNRR
jgi:hypothetical protein